MGLPVNSVGATGATSYSLSNDAAKFNDEVSSNSNGNSRVISVVPTSRRRIITLNPAVRAGVNASPRSRSLNRPGGIGSGSGNSNSSRNGDASFTGPRRRLIFPNMAEAMTPLLESNSRHGNNIHVSSSRNAAAPTAMSAQQTTARETADDATTMAYLAQPNRHAVFVSARDELEAIRARFLDTVQEYFSGADHRHPTLAETSGSSLPIGAATTRRTSQTQSHRSSPARTRHLSREAPNRHSSTSTYQMVIRPFARVRSLTENDGATTAASSSSSSASTGTLTSFPSGPPVPSSTAVIPTRSRNRQQEAHDEEEEEKIDDPFTDWEEVDVDGPQNDSDSEGNWTIEMIHRYRTKRRVGQSSRRRIQQQQQPTPFQQQAQQRHIRYVSRVNPQDQHHNRNLSALLTASESGNENAPYYNPHRGVDSNGGGSNTTSANADSDSSSMFVFANDRSSDISSSDYLSPTSDRNSFNGDLFHRNFWRRFTRRITNSAAANASSSQPRQPEISTNARGDDPYSFDDIFIDELDEPIDDESPSSNATALGQVVEDGHPYWTSLFARRQRLQNLTNTLQSLTGVLVRQQQHSRTNNHLGDSSSTTINELPLRQSYASVAAAAPATLISSDHPLDQTFSMSTTTTAPTGLFNGRTLPPSSRNRVRTRDNSRLVGSGNIESPDYRGAAPATTTTTSSTSSTTLQSPTIASFFQDGRRRQHRHSTSASNAMITNEREEGLIQIIHDDIVGGARNDISMDDIRYTNSSSVHSNTDNMQQPRQQQQEHQHPPIPLISPIEISEPNTFSHDHFLSSSTPAVVLLSSTPPTITSTASQATYHSQNQTRMMSTVSASFPPHAAGSVGGGGSGPLVSSLPSLPSSSSSSSYPFNPFEHRI